ncbi:hypothetical protein C0J52_03481 [Blattella germanica]|nr:hypothetical protein C0J52_03481 [Blattella germanica]
MMWSFFSRDPSKDFPYEIGEAVPGLEDKSVWSLHKAKRKGSGEDVSVFVFDIKNSSETQFEIAKTAVKRLKTLRHPSILTYLDSLESEKVLYLATEYVEPLEVHVTQLSKEGHQRELYLAWGIFQITRALSFLNNDGNLRHNNVCLSSVFVNAAGEWKLGGVEYVAGSSEGTGLAIKILPALEKYDPPEKSDPSKQRLITKCSTDMWGLGCLIWEAFNEEIQIKDKGEKNRFFSAITPQLDNFPENVCRHKILPQLITAFEYGDAGSAVLMPMFKLGRLLDEADYQKKIVPCVVKLFASTDRATRIRLLQQLEHFIGHLQAATSVIHLAPKLNYNNLNVEVLRHFARLQSKDDQGGIRTNTTVCLGKIAQHLHPQIRQKVLISAFIRAMRDPFPPARSAGVLALAATQQYFLLSEVALRILPALCQLTVDSEKSVRDNVFRTIKGFLGKLERVSEDPSLRESMATWAGWAVTAVTAKFYRSQSDTVKSLNPVTSKTLSKPGSLEQPSSSSISTTTSSTPASPPSTMSEPKSPLPGTRERKGTDGWDTEEWGSLEEDPIAESSPGEGWANSDFVPVDELNSTSGGIKSISLQNLGEEPKSTQGWEDTEWEPLETGGATNRLEEARKKREERKLQRQKELEARRATKLTGGPMKLGTKKI